jgi:hypothetical protein
MNMIKRFFLYPLAVLMFSACVFAKDVEVESDPSKYYRIQVVDSVTGRGIPLVRVEVSARISYYTDSAGMVAFHEPGLMGQKLMFYFRSHGYELDGGKDKEKWDTKGLLLNCSAGGRATVKMIRHNIAQRLYRNTGYGIYQDSLLLGDKAPIEFPMLNCGVIGQDSAVTTLYRNKIFWIWGDTHAMNGGANLKTTAAVSELPEHGGVDPDVGINLNYFSNDNNTFTRRMVPGMDNLVWLRSLVSAKDRSGKDHLIASYARIKDSKPLALGLLEFNPKKGLFESIFEELADVAEENRTVHGFASSTLRVTENKKDYFYYLRYHLSRSPIDYESVIRPDSYEAFTCLVPGTGMDGQKTRLNRDADGKLVWSWAKRTAPVGIEEMRDLVRWGLMQPNEKWIRMTDIETGKELRFKRCSPMYNPYRKRYIIVALEAGGTSPLGEYWYAEADTPMGPWTYARKIVTHRNYSFYNPLIHPYFSKDNGRVIYFEGTYTTSFSGADMATPRYNYNQIMYKLELDDPRLNLPVPVYRFSTSTADLRTGNLIPESSRSRIPLFYACDRRFKNCIPMRLSKEQGKLIPLMASDDRKASFYALPVEMENPPPETILLYESEKKGADGHVYSVEQPKPGDRPVCRVWGVPTTFNPYEVK